MFLPQSRTYAQRMSEPQRDSASAHRAVAAEVRAQLARRRISGRQAAFALGWKQPYIARRLSGDIPFDVNDLDALARLLDVPVAAFFDVRGGTSFQVIDGFRTGPSSTPRVSQFALAA